MARSPWLAEGRHAPGLQALEQVVRQGVQGWWNICGRQVAVSFIVSWTAHRVSQVRLTLYQSDTSPDSRCEQPTSGRTERRTG